MAEVQTVYDQEREVSPAEAAALRGEIQRFIQQYKVNPTFMMTFRKDGRPIMRPVITFVEGWTIGTITQDKHVKTQHLRNNPIVGYLFVGTEGSRGFSWAPKNVFVQGVAELIDDPSEVEAFFQRRLAVAGEGDAHPHDQTYKRILVRVTPQYLRAEGWAKEAQPVVIRDFSY